MKRELPLLITAVTGLVFAISYFIPHWPFGEAENIFGDWYSIIAAFAIWLGLLNLVQISLQKVARKSEGWQYGLITVISLIIMLVIGFAAVINSINDGTAHDAGGTPYKWMYTHVYSALSSTMFSMLAFFVASASYRAFRARSFESTLLLITAFFVMAGRVPLFDPIVSYLGITDTPIFSGFADWIMAYANTAGQRAIMIGIALGITSSSLRVILGIERSHIGGDS